MKTFLVRPGNDPQTITLKPSAGIDGRIIAADTSEPIEGATVRYTPPGEFFYNLPSGQGMGMLLGDEAVAQDALQGHRPHSRAAATPDHEGE